jgi:DinB superfamily
MKRIASVLEGVRPMTDPQTRPEILQALRALHERSTRYWDAFSDTDFLAPIGEAWSPADNVRHLVKSISAVARGLRAPKPLLFVLFGPSRRASRDYGGLRDVYRGILAGGAKAGRFAPAPQGPPADPAAWRRELMARQEAAAEALERAIGPWSEKALDRYRMPHPLLGKLSVREMLLFTLYHNLHHVQNVARRTGIVFAVEE